MDDTKSVLNKAQRKKAARKQRKQSERQAHRNLDDVTSEAVERALALAPEVVDASSARESERAIEVEIASLSEAQFVRKRINDALHIGEWLDDVHVWIWRSDEHQRPPLTSAGRHAGFELRLEKMRRE